MHQPDREETIFASLLALPASQRSAFLDKNCNADPDLRRRVEELLEAHSAGDGFMEEPVAPAPRNTILVTFPLSEKSGDRIGRYKLLEQIGEGGCGVVYVAEQEEPVRRRVALKVIKLGMDTKQVIARFEAERQALALMDHPNIAKVLDAGATAIGRPYFVMELVRGVKITEYCEQNNLSARERLTLFVQVCRAIQHAHQKGIIHRDIKPSNILVTVNDAIPVPKVIDFGIAKATAGRLTDQTVYTAFEQFLGTPAYMSPEQAVMTSQDIDTRSDIYSLGVLLYELLTGQTPFEIKELLEAGLDEMRRTIREKEPPRPSTRLTELIADEEKRFASKSESRDPKSELENVALRRLIREQQELIHLLRGDLDWIVMKCLEKDRGRRYETANGLASDIQRHLESEPVAARPPSRLYRFQKLVRRNKIVFGAAASLALALALGTLVSTLQAVRASRAEAAAQRAAQQAEAINRFLTESLLYQATPDENARERQVTMEEGLKLYGLKLDEDRDIARQPELEASLRLGVGTTFQKLGLLGEAERHLRRAVFLRRSKLGKQHLETLAAQAALAKFLVFGTKNFNEGEALSRDTWELQRKLLGPGHRDTLDSMSTYLWALSDQGKFELAESLARECLNIHERTDGPDKLETIDALGNLGHVLAMRGDYQQAERCEAESIARFQRAGLTNKEGAFYSINNLAGYRLMLGRASEAEKLLVEACPRAARVFGEHPVTLQLSQMLARVLEDERRLDEAESRASDTLEVRRRVTPGQEGLGRTLLILGRILMQKDQLDKAEPLLQESLALFRENYSMKQELAAQAANWLGAIQLARHNYPAAESLLMSSSEALLSPTAGISLGELRALIEHIVELQQAMGKVEQADVWQKKMDAIIKLQTRGKSK